jgi:hypothetical protein
MEEYVRVARQAMEQAHDLQRLLDEGNMPALARHLKTSAITNPYTLMALADLSKRRAHRESGRAGGDATHNQRNRAAKKAAMDWFETVRATVSKNEAASLIASKFSVSRVTARDWLKGV